MAWFKRDKKSIEQSTPPEERRVRTEGLWVQVRILPHHRLPQGPRSKSLRLPQVPVPFQNELQAAPGNAPRRPLDRARRGHGSTDPLKFVDTKPYVTRLREAKKNSA